jgi:hypothetical protein
VFTVRRECQATAHDVVASLTDERLAAEVTRSKPGRPHPDSFLPVKECPHIILNENGSSGSIPNVT